MLPAPLVPFAPYDWYDFPDAQLGENGEAPLIAVCTDHPDMKAWIVAVDRNACTVVLHDLAWDEDEGDAENGPSEPFLISTNIRTYVVSSEGTFAFAKGIAESLEESYMNHETLVEKLGFVLINEEN